MENTIDQIAEGFVETALENGKIVTPFFVKQGLVYEQNEERSTVVGYEKGGVAYSLIWGRILGTVKYYDDLLKENTG